MIVFAANEASDWGLLGLHGRKSGSVALLIGILAYIFVVPTYDEIKGNADANKSGDDTSH
jgi:hypothetical protein